MGLLTASYGATLDPASMARIAKLIGSAGIFATYYRSAMNYSVNLVKAEAVKRAPVQSGNLRRAAVAQVLSPWEGVVGFSPMAPYARRREFGFDNQTDALGRYYALDPIDPDKRANMHYLQRGYDASLPAIRSAFSAATMMSLKTIAF